MLRGCLLAVVGIVGLLIAVVVFAFPKILAVQNEATEFAQQAWDAYTAETDLDAIFALGSEAFHASITADTKNEVQAYIETNFGRQVSVIEPFSCLNVMVSVVTGAGKKSTAQCFAILAFEKSNGRVDINLTRDGDEEWKVHRFNLTILFSSDSADAADQ